jgi:energy-coupling factor transporter ATP-binding protein EcfA2
MTGQSDLRTYPADYRASQVRAILGAVRAGECVSVVGLSGAGKSNLLLYLAGLQPLPDHHLVLVDCNRMPERSLPALFRLVRLALGERSGDDELETVDAAIERHLQGPSGKASALTLMFDRFDALSADPNLLLFAGSNLRALRDAHKYQLTYLTATRRPLPSNTEFAELFLANTLWLGALSRSDAIWNVQGYADRKGLAWTEAEAETLIRLTGAYPALLRAACEAFAAGSPLEAVAQHASLRLRLEEFWADAPGDEELRLSGLASLPLLSRGRAPVFDTTRLTAKENALLAYFQAHPKVVCQKDDLIRAVWPEDQVFEKGVRDDSLAQLVRRLREKIEPDPSAPRYVHTAPGRGYRFSLGHD